MEKSFFIQYIQKFFSGIVSSTVTKLNDKKGELVYYHKRFLKKEYSVDGKWESINATNTMVMADVISMDSSLPLKKRDSLSKASGDIPKMGMELSLREQQLTNLDTLKLRPGTEPQLIAKLFEDTPKVIGGVFERDEAIFLEAVSTGVCAIDDTENVGTGIRIDYGFLNENKFGAASVVWSNIASTPIEDLKRMRRAARSTGNTIIKFLMDDTAFTNLAKTTEVKNFYGFHVGFNGAATQVPTLEQLNIALKANYSFTIEIIDRTVTLEKNGVRSTLTPWATGAVVGICTESLGKLVWATLAEANHPVSGVAYETADEYILVSKFRTNKPSLAEYTTSQARVIPVLTNTDQIYLLDSTAVQA